MATEFDPVITDTVRRAGFVEIALDGHPVGVIYFENGRVASGLEDHPEPTVRVAVLVFTEALTIRDRASGADEVTGAWQETPYGAPDPFIETEAAYQGLHPGIVEAYGDELLRVNTVEIDTSSSGWHPLSCPAEGGIRRPAGHRVRRRA
jgi:hypothetical protein